MNDQKYPIITKRMLQKNSLEVCEFCEEAFTNKFDSLIHNASHIIIPLMKQNFVTCSKCDYECVSQNDLHQHILIEHPVIIKTEKLSLWDIKTENNVINDNDIENINYDNNYTYLASDHDSEIKLKNEDDILDTNSDFIITNKTNSSLANALEISGTIDNSIRLKKPSIKDKLMFESDNDVKVQLDSDCMDDCKPTNTAPKKIVSFNLNVANSISDEDIETPLILFTSQDVDNQLNETDYHSLMAPKILFCRYCSAIFRTRYTLIIHEQKHIKFKQKIMGMLCLHCDKYIAGNYVNLSKHIDSKHAKDKYKVYCTSVCKKCGLQYRSYKHHIYNYHFTKCCTINKFVTDNNFKNHLEKCLCHTHVLSVCRPCYVVLKEDFNFKCMMLGIKHMKGVRQDCKKCNSKVNEIISVKLSCKIQSKYQCWYVQDKPMSNKDRLKNIRMRLKKLNILSKMYCFVLICDANNSLVIIMSQYQKCLHTVM